MASGGPQVAAAAVPGDRASWADLLAKPRPLIMGVVNITPDSFADGGLYFSPELALRHALDLAEAGADILDLGGESTRPFSEPLPLEEELRRVIPVIAQLRPRVSLPLSIDTYKAPVARAALEAGADIINDISALRFDPHMAPLAREARAPVILMHMQGVPRDMQTNPHYDDLLGEIKAFLAQRRDFALSQGIPLDRIVLDPGIGFGKTFQHNLEIINNFDTFTDLGCPLLIGPSRKAFIGHLLGGLPPAERDVGTLAALAVAVARGAAVVRVHNVRLARQFFTVFRAITAASRISSAKVKGHMPL
uniref:Dihydropteroate synthase n=1 Tax=Desulfobacca acetoxidans TaxID=60893 RepID=A0A7V4G842_9BACT